MNTLPKYQAWHEAEKKMYQVFSMRMEETDHLAQIAPIHVLVSDPAAAAFFGGIGISSKHFDLSEVKLRKYIGLKDRNGNDIYTGDIVQTTYSFRKEQGKAQVVIEHLTCGIRWLSPQDPTDFGFKPLYDPSEDPDDDGTLSWDLTTFEIIGNVYENPGLLGGTKEG